jgi:hypothetical protein
VLPKRLPSIEVAMSDRRRNPQTPRLQRDSVGPEPTGAAKIVWQLGVSFVRSSVLYVATATQFRSINYT